MYICIRHRALAARSWSAPSPVSSPWPLGLNSFKGPTPPTARTTHPLHPPQSALDQYHCTRVSPLPITIAFHSHCLSPLSTAIALPLLAGMASIDAYCHCLRCQLMSLPIADHRGPATNASAGPKRSTPSICIALRTKSKNWQREALHLGPEQVLGANSAAVSAQRTT